RSHGKRLICFGSEFGKRTTPSAGHFVGGHIRREWWVAHYTKVHENGFEAIFPDQPADELEFHTFGIQRTDDDNRAGHNLPPYEKINNNALTANNECDEGGYAKKIAGRCAWIFSKSAS